jgi:hypothetical protein
MPVRKEGEMSATEVLRRLLDERGVEWTNPNSCLRDEMTSWVANGFDYDAFEVPDGTLVLTAAHQDDLTPEQAVEATLGPLTERAAKDSEKDSDGRGECRIVEDEFGHPTCSECGAMQPEDYTVYYCWCCGCMVKED